MTASPLAPGRRIAVVGTSGAGKTYVAAALARILKLTYVCNDAIIWRPNWQGTPKEVVLCEIDAATRGNGWTFDGNLRAAPEDLLVLERCDTIVWLDLPRWQVWWSITRRTIGRVISKEPLWHGNVERWRTVFSRDSMILWSIRSFGRRRRTYAALFADSRYADRVLIQLRSRLAVDLWLASLAAVALSQRSNRCRTST